MGKYQRPQFEPREFLDDAGNPIAYGDRWADMPPDEAYEATSHLERFAPLHAVADALIEHLKRNYKVEVTERGGDARSLLRPDDAAELGEERATLGDTEVIKVVRVRPENHLAAELTFIYTAFPGVHLYSGLITEHIFPTCGCDACDETWEPLADDLEQIVLAVVEGRFAESLQRKGLRSWWGEFTIYDDDGEPVLGSQSEVHEYSRAEYRAMRMQLIDLGGPWEKWKKIRK